MTQIIYYVRDKLMARNIDTHARHFDVGKYSFRIGVLKRLAAAQDVQGI